ncbi:MAG: hypothetical protein V4622_12840 [Bacteroidota bacterium]
MNKFKWINEHFSTKKENSWNQVSDIIPDIFDEYFLVHWKVGIVDKFPFDEYPEKNETIEQINKRIKIEREFGLFLNNDEEKLFREINLKEVSNIFKTIYNYKILDNIKQTPAIKTLEKETKIALKSGLKKISNNQVLNFFVEDINRFPIDEKSKQEYIGIDIENYLKLQDDFYYDYCTYLFPDDLSWCLTTSEYLPMFLCVKKELSKQISNEINLELFKVEYNTELF